ncbi:MAG: YbfB/YjiJ family MFS transporter [Rhodospirillales bacterium]|nr:YbfB/YjiJ family MFS transporter [Rhodospirillales bacterium]
MTALPSPRAAIMAGVCATLLGVGLQRFAYAPLVPAMVGHGWLTAGEAGTLGAANFAGYLVGAAIAPAAGRRLGMRPALRLGMLTATLCLLLCAWRGPLAWLLPWRTLAGIAGGVLMVLAGPAVQAAVPVALRGLAAGLLFAGVGGGIMAGALIVPALLPAGLPATWLALAAAGLALSLLSWPRWPAVPPPPAARLPDMSGATGRLVAAYGFASVAATAHMAWWPDFIARGLGMGAGMGAAGWFLYGVGAALGPALCGMAADRVGTRRAFSGTLLLQLLPLSLPLVAHSLPFLAISALLGGATAAGTTGLTLARARDLGGDAAPGIWRIGTVAWAAAQMATGFLMAWLYAHTGSHMPIFAVGLGGAVIAAVVGRR